MQNVIYYPANADSLIVAGARIARWLHGRMKKSIMVDAKTIRSFLETNKHQPYNLYIINVPKPMVAHVELAENLISHAKTLVWIQNDYAIQTPTPHTAGMSIFTKAFTYRAQNLERLPMWVWTSCADRVDHIPTMARYINWNALAADELLPLKKPTIQKVLYWGAYRPGRQQDFRRYFGAQAMNESELVVSATKNGKEKFFAEAGTRTGVFIPPISIPDDLQNYAATVYIEDEMSHRRFHSPANRFYEAIAAGLPLLVAGSAAGTLQKAGYTVPVVWQVTSGQDVVRALHAPGFLANAQRAQRKAWGVDPTTGLSHGDALWKHVTKLQKECKV